MFWITAGCCSALERLAEHLPDLKALLIGGVELADVQRFALGADQVRPCGVLSRRGDPLLDAIAQDHPVLCPGALLPIVPEGLEAGVAADDHGVFAPLGSEQLSDLGGDVEVEAVLSLFQQLADLEPAAGIFDVIQVSPFHSGGGGAVEDDDVIRGKEIFATPHPGVVDIFVVD